MKTRLSRLASHLPAGVLVLSLIACQTVAENETRIGPAWEAGEPDQAPGRDQTVAAVKSALELGIRQSVTTLGRSGGFYGNRRVEIGVPEALEEVARVLERLGQEEYVRQFTLSLNRAAEQAVPEAMEILLNALAHLSVADAVAIVQGPDNAATVYFRQSSEAALKARFRPVVRRATRSVGVTYAYKKLLSRAGHFPQLSGWQPVDLDEYVTRRALDGLFLYIAREERAVRRDPVARSSQVVRTVFGYYLD